jgi:3-methylfumaryl-CoA hydratase
MRQGDHPPPHPPDRSQAPDLREWIGRREVLQETLAREPVLRLGALLDQDLTVVRGYPIPPLWHWVYFLPNARQLDLGSDGHPRRGGFLPPVPKSHRLFAGGRAWFHAPLRIGETATRIATITDVREKVGSSGPLTFVTVHYEYRAGKVAAIIEEHDLVYRDATASAAARGHDREEVPDLPWRASFRPDPVLLFRVSALLYNAHRIHYDWRYATQVEGYPGLVVQGPLLALWLIDLARANAGGLPIDDFSFRARAPLFDGDQVLVVGGPDSNGRRAEMFVYSRAGLLAMDASVTFGAQKREDA